MKIINPGQTQAPQRPSSHESLVRILQSLVKASFISCTVVHILVAEANTHARHSKERVKAKHGTKKGKEK